VIGLPRGLTVFMYGEPVDMRKSFDTLSALVAHEMKRDLLEGDLFLFVGRDRKRAKVLYFDGTGLCLLSKRLEQGQFGAPWKQRRSEMTLSQLALFIDGSEAARKPLSPPLLRRAILEPKVPTSLVK
jgi:transposase